MSTLTAAVLVAVVVLLRPSRADARARTVTSVASGEAQADGVAGDVLGGYRLAALLDLIAAALDVGLAPVAAVESAAVGVPEPARSRLRRVVSMVEVGGDPAAVWSLLSHDPLIGPLAHALERSERSGAPVAMAVRTLADETRREIRAVRLAEARRVGVRTAAPLGACFLPSFFLIAIVPTIVALIHDVL